MSRVVVFGLDGLSCTLARALADEGVMPSLRALLQAGRLAAMDTVHPPLSSVAWTTFATGVNPGKHRIFGFFETQIDAYDLWFQDLNDVKAPTLWELAQSHGKRTVCLNLPGTYPAPPMNGVMVSGFVAHDLARSVYPHMLKPALENIDYLLDVPCEGVLENPPWFFNLVRQSLAARERLTATLLEYEPCDLFISVVTETDRLQHFFWDALEEPSHPWRDATLNAYRTIDAMLGRWMALCRPDDTVILLADHGFCRVEQEIYVNHWLKEQGYLAMRSDRFGAPLREMDPGRTRAFALDPGRIYLNLRGRQPAGCVAPEEAPALLREIASGLERLTVRAPWSIEPVRPITRVFRREELYHGAWARWAPDLIAHAEEGFELRGKLNSPSLNRLGGFSGMHTYGNAMLYVREREWRAANPKIVDLAPTILHLLGIEPPEGMDGRVIL